MGVCNSLISLHTYWGVSEKSKSCVSVVCSECSRVTACYWCCDMIVTRKSVGMCDPHSYMLTRAVMLSEPFQQIPSMRRHEWRTPSCLLTLQNLFRVKPSVYTLDGSTPCIPMTLFLETMQLLAPVTSCRGLHLHPRCQMKGFLPL